jgi:aminopeptidase N
VSNGAALEAGAATGGGTTSFAETEPLPTYLFAFAAGRFTVQEGERDGRTFRMFHR